MFNPSFHERIEVMKIPVWDYNVKVVDGGGADMECTIIEPLNWNDVT